MGLTTAGLVSHHGHAYIDTFENSVQVQLKVENEHGHSLEYAHIFWQVGFKSEGFVCITDSLSVLVTLSNSSAFDDKL